MKVRPSKYVNYYEGKWSRNYSAGTAIANLALEVGINMITNYEPIEKKLVFLIAKVAKNQKFKFHNILLRSLL